MERMRTSKLTYWIRRAFFFGGLAVVLLVGIVIGASLNPSPTAEDWLARGTLALAAVWSLTLLYIARDESDA
jgi:hypothetical protein